MYTTTTLLLCKLLLLHLHLQAEVLPQQPDLPKLQVVARGAEGDR